MFRKILLLLDGTNLSDRTTEYALSYAKAARGDIVAVSIAPMTEDAGAVRLTDFVAEMARRMGVHCDAVEIKSASPARAIVEAAKNYCCDVIYITLHTPSGQLKATFSESLAYQVLEESTIPVLLFR
jgi:nucleotide-binding universal stress UspA family protein